MKNEIQLALYMDKVGYIMLNELEGFITRQMGNIVGTAGKQVIHTDNFVAFF